MKLPENSFLTFKQIAIGLIELDKQNGMVLKYENINSYIDRAISMTGLTVEDEDRKRLFHDIEYQYQIAHSEGHSIFDDYEDPHNWYTLSEKEDTYFWSRYREYLINSTSIDIKSINLLDEVTLPAIMNCLGNPKDEFEGTRLKRGLIIGDVQSGKTATYSGLICKAADAGYKVVILLAGITENLRQQTQERIDEGIIGFSIKKDGKREISGRVGVGLDQKALKATSFTSCARDFIGDCDKISTSLEAHNSLVIFVVKKNVSVLTKLYKWLKDQNIDPVLGCVNNPMLLIDDEADNASVNTNSAEVDPTKTNRIIRNICGLFKNATYVGFTATPFANVFIDPDSVDKMKQADLFPEHFIYALPTPSTYIGAEKIFYEDGVHYRNLRFISDIEEPDYASDEYRDLVRNNVEALNNGPFYYRHKKEWHGELPASLRTSILCFFITNVVRDLRGQRTSPRSMLVNMSRFIRVQNIIRDEIEIIWNSFVNTIRFDFSDSSEKNTHLPLYKELKSIWEVHFSNIIDVSFERVIEKHTILESVSNIKILVVNGSRTSGKLDYKENKSLRVIAIGGLALSRGLTLEGLMVSYFYRNTATFDVLMQMGRWFGYRHGYEDLFQIWTSEISADWYAEISRASVALKEDIRTMCEQQLTPKDFGIKVRDNSEELQITAANKMRSSYNLRMQYSFYGNIYDTPYISLSVKQNKQNWTKTKELVSKLFHDGYRYRFADVGRFDDSLVNNTDIGTSRFFESVPKEIVIDYLSGIKCSMANLNFNVENILSFIKDESTIGDEIWDIVFEGGESRYSYDIPGLSAIKCPERAIYAPDRRVVQISSRRRLLGTREGKFALNPKVISIAEKKCRDHWREEEGDDPSIDTRAIPLKAYFEYLPERKPVLIIMLIHPKPYTPDPTKPHSKFLEKFTEELGEDKLVAFAIGFPNAGTRREDKYFKVNKVYYQLYMQDEAENTEEVEDEQ